VASVEPQTLFDSYVADITLLIAAGVPSEYSAKIERRKETEKLLKRAADVIPTLPADRRTSAQRQLWLREGELYFNIAMTGFVDGKPGRKAIAVLTKLVTADPSCAPGWYWLGNLYAQEGRGPKAKEAYEHAIKGNEKDLAIAAQKELTELRHNKNITGPRVNLVIACVLVIASLFFMPCLIFTVPYVAFRAFQYLKKNS